MPGDLPVPRVEVAEPVREELEVVRHPRHHAAPVRAEQGAVVAGLDLSQVLDPGPHPGGDSAQDGCPLGRRSRRPAAKRCPGGPDRRVDLRLPAPGNLGDGCLVDRGHVSERGGRGNPAATDPMAGVHCDAGHVRRALFHLPPSRYVVPQARRLAPCWLREAVLAAGTPRVALRRSARRLRRDAAKVDKGSLIGRQITTWRSFGTKIPYW